MSIDELIRRLKTLRRESGTLPVVYDHDPGGHIEITSTEVGPELVDVNYAPKRTGRRVVVLQ